jgi:hypothetical protein
MSIFGISDGRPNRESDNRVVFVVMCDFKPCRALSLTPDPFRSGRLPDHWTTRWHEKWRTEVCPRHGGIAPGADPPPEDVATKIRHMGWDALGYTEEERRLMEPPK